MLVLRDCIVCSAQGILSAGEELDDGFIESLASAYQTVKLMKDTDDGYVRG